MTETRAPSLIDALIPVVSLILMLALSVTLFGSDSSYGPNQIVLILGAAIASIIALKNGFAWTDILEAIIDGISTAMGAILILLSVGALIGTWLMSGTVPSLIYYGVEILSPTWFYAAACIICAIAALSIGSSWTVAGTLGVALIGISGSSSICGFGIATGSRGTPLVLRKLVSAALFRSNRYCVFGSSATGIVKVFAA